MTGGIRAERPLTDDGHAMAFAVLGADLLRHLTIRTTGDVLRRGLERAAEHLRVTTVPLSASDHTAMINGLTLPARCASTWGEFMRGAGVQAVSFARDTSERELLLFLALLSAPGDSHAFGTSWLEHGSWRVHVVCDAARAWDTELGPADANGDADPLTTLCEAIARGRLHHPHSTILAELKPFGADTTARRLAMLSASANGSRRRLLYDGIVSLGAGGNHLGAALHNAEWHVVRNAAALLGELRVTDAAAELAELLSHREFRVRAASAIALGQLDTPRAHDGLLLAVDDPHEEVRRSAWSAISLGAIAPSAAQLDSALRRETHPDVQQALLACAAAFPDLDVSGGLVRLCAREFSCGGSNARITFGVEQLAVRRPDIAKALMRRLPERFAAA